MTDIDTDADTLFWVLSISDTIMVDTDTDTQYLFLFNNLFIV